MIPRVDFVRDSIWTDGIMEGYRRKVSSRRGTKDKVLMGRMDGRYGHAASGRFSVQIKGRRMKMTQNRISKTLTGDNDDQVFFFRLPCIIAPSLRYSKKINTLV